MIRVPIVPSDFSAIALELDLTDTLISAEYCQFLNMRKVPLIIFSR